MCANININANNQVTWQWLILRSNIIIIITNDVIGNILWQLTVLINAIGIYS